MKERTSTLLRGGTRASTGIIVIGVAALAALTLGTVPLPAVEREPVAITVDTLQGAERQVVCSGAFTVLGADPSRPGVALPTGETSVVVSGETRSTTDLTRDSEGGTPPQVFGVAAGDPFAAAQRQTVTTDTLRGVTASACAEPANEQWLVGGASTLGITTTVTLANPTGVPATVQLTVFDENVEVDAALTTGVLVPAGNDRTVSLNGYAPGRERLAVRVVSTGAAVTATLGIAHVSNLDPFAVDTVTRQLAPSDTLIIPGLANASVTEAGPGDAGKVDPFSVRFRVLAPSGAAGTATVVALTPDGRGDALATLDYADGAVAETQIPHWPVDASAVIISAPDPIVGAALGSADEGGAHDTAWFSPAPLLAAGTAHAVAVVPGGRLVLVNPGAEPAEVTLGDRSVAVPAGAAVRADASGATTLTSTTPIAAGVRVFSGPDIAGYPVLPLADRASSITVYTR